MATAVQARPRGPAPGCAVTVFFLLTFAFSCMSPTTASELISSVPDSAICKGIDIRNSLESFKQLNGCKVIEGALQILLFDNVNETDFDNISFPELTEITDFLLLFRVNGLKSIGQLFPNLAVIRGQNLLPGLKALIIFEMASLQEIGLHSLTDIMQGTVHIDKNPSLCFVNTIDWTRIVHDQPTEIFTRNLKPENECPVCPASVGGQACPRDDKSPSKSPLCWNRNHCQKICTGCGNRTCNAKGECCDEHCLGGCKDDDVTKCKICRNYALADHGRDAAKCVTNCPKDFYTFLGRRCVTKYECINMIKPVEAASDVPERPYKIFNGSCLLTCPPDYADNNINHSCKKCDHTCKKECTGARIDSINLATKLRGCTHITSSLEIQIRGGNKVVKVLEENLGMIEEIDGYLKVVRSFSLVSLNFFKSLKRIRGKYLDTNKYSLVVLDNQNLLDLFDWDKHNNFKIDNGSLFFHFNPKLCMNKIEKLREISGLPPFNSNEVASNSNGDKVACNVTELKVKVSKIDSKGAVLDWHPFPMDDNRKLLSYIVYRIEAPTRTINFYDGRDACGQDNWHVDDVANTGDKDPVTHPITNLKPYTQYAFYIKTYTIATEQYGAQSKIQYFTTMPSAPSVPQVTSIISKSSDSFTVKWRPPLRANGKITHYIVSGVKIETSPQFNRDYCTDKVTPVESKKSAQPVMESPKPRKNVCEKLGDDSLADNNERSYDEQEEQNRIDFENELQNRIYVKRPNKTKRDTDMMIDKDSANKTDTYPSQPELSAADITIENQTEPGGTWKSFSYPVYGASADEYVIRNLHHFTSYEINVKACREPAGNETTHPCGESYTSTEITMKSDEADNITNISVSNITFDSATVYWTQPPDPNGMIVSVNIYYKPEPNNAVLATGNCIYIKDFPLYSGKNGSMNYTITNLLPGNYSIYLQASSFAGNGPESNYVNCVIPEKKSNTVLITILVLLLVTMNMLVVFWWFYGKTMKERNNMRLIPAVNPEYIPSVYIPDEWEVPRKKIELIKELGQGSFGMVWEGIAYDIRGQTSVKCAVKTVNEHATNRERADFLNEASVMKAFDTTHVVRLLGVVSQGQPTLVIMELMAQGDLKTYLRSHRPENNDRKSAPTLKHILQMAIEIADGMAYLEAKKFVHRDLAARNCMVSDAITVKIGDFGMTRDIYETDYYRKGSKGLLPVRWMAPESLKDGVFSSSSDVWSYGVVLWEMATLASQPYQGLANDQVLRYVIDGGVMERPENCPDKLYELMRHCWDPKPGRRPTFMKLCQLLLPDATEHFPKVSFYHSPAGNEARIARASTLGSTDNGDVDIDVDEADASTPLNALPPDVRIVSGYGMSVSGRSDSIQSVHLDPNPRFYSISEDRTTNGYVGNRVKNGKAQSHC